MERTYNVYCQTTKTCTWREIHLDDHEDAVGRGRTHAIKKHPETDEWRVRVLTVRPWTSAELQALLEQHRQKKVSVKAAE